MITVNKIIVQRSEDVDIVEQQETENIVDKVPLAEREDVEIKIPAASVLNSGSSHPGSR